MLEVDGRTETYDGVGPLVLFADGVTLFTPGGGRGPRRARGRRLAVQPKVQR